MYEFVWKVCDENVCVGMFEIQINACAVKTAAIADSK